MTTLYCSGVAGGFVLSPGLAVARSLREAFADLRIVGVADTPHSGSLHDPAFDEVWVREPAHDEAAHTAAILERLDAGAWWICGSELQARRLARAAGSHERLLSPSTDALSRFDAPAGDLARRLGVGCPPAISPREEDWRLSAFGREHGWRLWLTGPDRAPTRIDGWRTLERTRAHLAAAWSYDGMALQAQVEGAREAIVFAGWRGAMLGAWHMRAALEPAQGATWGGHVADLAETLPDVLAALARELSAGAWTGGGELELVRAVDGVRWLVARRPHFASWVHSATLAGANLPAALVGAATGRDHAPAARRAAQFVRVVVEIPARPGLAVPEPVATVNTVVRAGGYLGGMPDPGANAAAGPHPREDAVRPDERLAAIVDGLPAAGHTPHAHALDPGPRWERLANAVRDAARGRRVELAYSIKTDPDLDLLRAARAHGFLAEAITAGEMQRALDAGYAGEAIVLNGPGKRWPPPAPGVRAYAVFADSLGELAELALLAESGELTARYLGPRVRLPSVASRFGVPLGDEDTSRGLEIALEALPASQLVGLHFHWASSEAGHETWFHTVEALLQWARLLQARTGRAISCLDLGGGWHPDDFDAVFLPRLPELVARCHVELDELDVIVLEPGRALVQPLSVVETTVLEVRDGRGAREIVVDASLAEVPRAPVYPHRILSQSDGEWLRWGRGPDRVLGRLCMEDDVLRTGVAVPDDVRAGSRVLIADAGAYDRSMAYRFGRG